MNCAVDAWSALFVLSRREKKVSNQGKAFWNQSFRIVFFYHVDMRIIKKIVIVNVWNLFDIHNNIFFLINNNFIENSKSYLKKKLFSCCIIKHFQSMCLEILHFNWLFLWNLTKRKRTFNKLVLSLIDQSIANFHSFKKHFMWKVKH